MLHISNLRKTFVTGKKKAEREEVVAVNDLTLEVEPGQLFTLLGPSGCGKTTTLRCVAGLEQPDSGEIKVADKVLFSSETNTRLEANERGLGMVFQSYAIWPHMDVFDNVAFPLQIAPRSRRPSKKQTRERVDRVLDVVQLGHLADRPATDLSGGQQQRLALARALVDEPPLLLLDEPLSNLDAQLREEMRFELRRLQRELNITAVYVTHDQVEALAMSNVVAVMNAGDLEQVGKPQDIYQRPKSHFVADFIGSANFLEGVVKDRDGKRFRVATDHGELRATSDLDFSVGDTVVLSVRPEYIEINEGAPDLEAVGRWGGSIEARAFLGESVDHLVSVGGREVQVRCHQSVSFAPGTEVTLQFPESLCSLIPRDA